MLVRWMPKDEYAWLTICGSLLATIGLLADGGILLIDNTDWNDPPHLHVPADWPLVHRSRNVLTETSI